VGAGRARLAVRGDDRGRVVLVGDERQHRDEQDRERAGEVDADRDGLLEHLARVAQVGVQDVHLRHVGEQCPGVGDGHGVRVDVDRVGLGVGREDDLVHVARGGDARAEVEELVDAGGAQVLDGAVEEGAVRAHHVRRVGEDAQGLLGQLPVGGEVVRAPEEVVVHARDGGPLDVDRVGSPGGPLRHDDLVSRPAARHTASGRTIGQDLAARLPAGPPHNSRA